MNAVLKRFLLTVSCFLLTFSLSAMSGGRPAPGHGYRRSSVTGKMQKNTAERHPRKIQPAQGGRIAAGPSGFSRTKKSKPNPVTPPRTREISEKRQTTPPVPRPEPVKKESEESIRKNSVRKASEYRPGHHRTVQMRDRGAVNNNTPDAAEPSKEAAVRQSSTASAGQGKRVVEKKSRSGK